MTDLVERLRLRHKAFVGLSEFGEAADEIERLSSALHNLLGQVEQAKEGFGIYAKSASMDAAIAHTKVLLGSS